MTDVVIIGGGGCAREACWVFLEDGKKWNVLGFIDDNPALQGSSLCDLPVLGDFGWLQSNASKNFRVLCAVGNPHLRKQLVQRAAALKLTFCAVLHPSVQLSRWVEIGPGSLICAGSILTTQVKLGAHVIVNLACTISHDSVIGSYCSINPSCHISGTVHLGDGVELGTGAVIIQNKSVGEWSTIGAGAVITSDIPAFVTAVGIPCRVIKEHQREFSLAIR